METTKDDRIYLSTRIISAIVVPVVVLAFIVLYFFPESSGDRFAWAIKPDMMDLFIGAGYLGGAYFFARAVVSRKWHLVNAGFPGVAAFTISMLLATILHWDRFDIKHIPFQLWLGLYIVTPFLVPWVWFHNRVTDPGTPESNDAIVPNAIRILIRILGGISLLMVLGGFIYPSALIAIWPWVLTPLTARVLSGWFALVAVGELVISFDSRWSSWRITLESIALWDFLLLVGSLFHTMDFTSGVLNWFMAAILFRFFAAIGFYVVMETSRQKALASA